MNKKALTDTDLLEILKFIIIIIVGYIVIKALLTIA